MFRARFSIAAGDRENFDGKRFPIIRGQIVIGEQGVVRSNDRELGGNLSVPLKIDNRPGGPGFSGRFDKFVAVEILTSQGSEKVPVLNSSRIRAGSFDQNLPIVLFEFGAGKLSDL